MFPVVPNWETVLSLRKKVLSGNEGRVVKSSTNQRACTGFCVIVEEPYERHKIRCPYSMIMTKTTAVIANRTYTWCLGCDALRAKLTVNVKVGLASTACFGICSGIFTECF
jgi:hypothetical protein